MIEALQELAKRIRRIAPQVADEGFPTFVRLTDRYIYDVEHLHGAVTAVCSPDWVAFPADPKEQVASLQALAGDALLRGDRRAWRALMLAAYQIETTPA